MKKAYFVALGLVGNLEDALELSQEAFSKAYQYRKTLNTQGKFFPWFYQILRNLCISHLRKRKHRQTSSLETKDGVTIDLPSSDNFDPEAVAERNEAKDRSGMPLAGSIPNTEKSLFLDIFKTTLTRRLQKCSYATRAL